MPRAGSITSRLVDCDITVMSIGGQDVLAYFRDCRIEFSVEEIDVTAPQDAWKQREICQADWRATCSKLIHTTQVFGDLVLAGGACVVSTDLGGSTFYGNGVIVGGDINSGNPNTESLTIVSAGGTPTLT